MNGAGVPEDAKPTHLAQCLEKSVCGLLFPVVYDEGGDLYGDGTTCGCGSQAEVVADIVWWEPNHPVEWTRRPSP